MTHSAFTRLLNTNVKLDSKKLVEAPKELAVSMVNGLVSRYHVDVSTEDMYSKLTISRENFEIQRERNNFRLLVA